MLSWALLANSRTRVGLLTGGWGRVTPGLPSSHLHLVLLFFRSGIPPNSRFFASSAPFSYF